MNKKQRRNVLKSLVFGSPAIWTTPIVDSVLLPAHAETTCSFCISWTVVGSGETGGVVSIFNQVGCSLIDNIGVSSVGACNDLAPGTYTVTGDGGGDDGTTVRVSAQCCGDGEVLGEGSDIIVAAEVEIFEDGSCEIRTGGSYPCTDL